MNPKENISGIERKVVDLLAAGYYQKELGHLNSRSRYPPHYPAKTEEQDSEPLNHRPPDVATRSSPCCTTSLDEQIRVLEAAARRKYLTAIHTIKPELPSRWFRQYLENRILPTFSRIGFDDDLTRALFSMAASSWQWMGPVGQSRHRCHPDLIREFEAIRDGILAPANRRRDPPKWPYPESTSKLTRPTGNLPDEQSNTNSTSWIILPRVYCYLGSRDCRYLPAYLRFIDRERNADCARIFIKCMIQFTANYSLKFAPENYPQNQLTAIVVNGYEAMFWKNLRSPPEGLEDASIFEGFQTWLNILRTRTSGGTFGRRRTDENLEVFKARIFPPKTGRLKQQPDSSGDGRYLVALRHGSRGIQSLQDYFGRSPTLLKTAAGTYLSYKPDLRTLNTFLKSIKAGYFGETAQTRQSIRKCLAYLTTTFKEQQRRLTPAGDGCRTLVGFVGPRAVGMIQAVCDDL